MTAGVNDAHLALAVGSISVTPRHPPWPSLWMGGYGWGRRGNVGAVARELVAHCAVLFDQGTPNVLVRIDTVSVPRDVHQAIRRRVVEEGLVASSDFLMVTSHTHSGPFLGDTQPDPYVMMGLDPADIQAINWSTDIFQDRIVQLVRDTVTQEPVPVTLGYATGSTDIAVNRTVLDTVLTEVPVVLARAVDGGAPVAVLFGYACHPVARGGDNVFDSDYCGQAALTLADQLGVPALFFQGACGDQNPDPIDGQGPQTIIDLGARLADTVLEVIDKNDFTPVTGPILTKLMEVGLPWVVDPTDPVVRDELIARYQQRLADHPEGTVVNRHARVMLRKLVHGELPPAIPMPIQRWRFGGLTIMALAHEPVSDYDVQIKALAPGPVWVMGYANEIGCYVTVDRLHWSGGYEAGWSGDDPLIAGIHSSQMAFGWPVPLKASPVGTTPPAPDSVHGIVLSACRDLLS